MNRKAMGGLVVAGALLIGAPAWSAAQDAPRATVDGDGHVHADVTTPSDTPSLPAPELRLVDHGAVGLDRDATREEDLRPQRASHSLRLCLDPGAVPSLAARACVEARVARVACGS